MKKVLVIFNVHNKLTNVVSACDFITNIFPFQQQVLAWLVQPQCLLQLFSTNSSVCLTWVVEFYWLMSLMFVWFISLLVLCWIMISCWLASNVAKQNTCCFLYFASEGSCFFLLSVYPDCDCYAVSVLFWYPSASEKGILPIQNTLLLIGIVFPICNYIPLNIQFAFVNFHIFPVE